jgi:hypothetical protein
MDQIRNSKTIAFFLSLVLTIFAIQHSHKFLPNSLILTIFFGVLILLNFYLERTKSDFLLQGLKKIIICQVAYVLFLFGWMKIFKLHLNTSIVYLDMPIGNLSGYEFSTAFYGYSYSFIIFIGSLQLIGSTLLLFQRTRLLGILILSPILANIIVTNIAYAIGLGVTLMASFLLLGCLFILLDDYEKIREVVFPTKNDNEISSNKFNYTITILIISIPFFLSFLNYKPHSNPQIIGKYLIKNYSINGNKIDSQNCTDTLLTAIYFDENQDCIFKYGNNFEMLKVGKLNTNKNEKKLEVTWRYPKNYNDTLRVNFKKIINQNSYQLRGKLGQNDIEMILTKEERKHNGG